MAKFNYIKFITEHKHGIEELGPTDHYIERTTERKIEGVFTPMSILGDEYDSDEFKAKLLKHIQNELNRRLEKLKNTDNIAHSRTHYIGYKILSPTVTKGGKTQPVRMSYIDGGKRLITELFLAIIHKNTLITFMGIKGNLDDIGLETQVANHNKNAKTMIMGNPEFIIDIDTLMGKAKQKTDTINIEDLPYKVRTDYRKGATLNHKKYGKRKIINTSSGTSGDPGISGRLEWVEIEVDEYPDLKAKIMRNSIKIPNIYTQSYFI